jgi:hypothetical protein
MTDGEVFADLLGEVEARRREFVVYAADEADADVVAGFDTRNVTVTHRSLPAGGPPGFVVIRDSEGEFAGSVGIPEVREFLSPPIRRPWDDDWTGGGYRALLAVLDEALFVSFDRRQLLATSREIEDRAWRAGRGTLRVGFQSRASFELQLAFYRRLGADTDLDVHVYGSPDWIRERPPIEAVTLHEAPEGLAAYWFLAFDGGGEPENACALVAEEWYPDDYRGFWSYDAGTVERIDDALGAFEG